MVRFMCLSHPSLKVEFTNHMKASYTVPWVKVDYSEDSVLKKGSSFEPLR